MAVIEAVEANLPRYPVANLSSIPPVRLIMAGQSSASASLNTTEHTDCETPRRNSTPTTPNVGIKHLWPNSRLGRFFLGNLVDVNTRPANIDCLEMAERVGLKPSEEA